jgi:hypothetical protein
MDNALQERENMLAAQEELAAALEQEKQERRKVEEERKQREDEIGRQLKEAKGKLAQENVAREEVSRAFSRHPPFIIVMFSLYHCVDFSLLTLPHHLIRSSPLSCALRKTGRKSCSSSCKTSTQSRPTSPRSIPTAKYSLASTRRLNCARVAQAQRAHEEMKRKLEEQEDKLARRIAQERASERQRQEMLAQVYMVFVCVRACVRDVL